MIMEDENTAKLIIKRIITDIKGACGAGVAFLVYYLIIHSIFNAFCPFLVITGIPCAGCGLTRAALYLLQGQAGRAAYINPSIFLLLVFALYCGYFRYIKGRPVRGIKIVLAVLTAGILTIYAVRMYFYFPGRAPYVYQSNNLLAAWVPGYREWMRGILDGIKAWRLGG
ncbi:MAG: DUF2752 domain-containing protein [Lachnospiraceae bacterium]|nr:DUF2752 domain-containing protein [Lachnospiraceae bacterium]